MTDSNALTTNKKIHASPTKDFFVKMITRDIALEDCIFDLLDNAIDGAHRQSKVKEDNEPLKGFHADITFDTKRFKITDNCGGIRLSDAIDYAFHFGRRPDSPADVEGGIGLYGIGMKRAIFKIGRKADVVSVADSCFSVSVDVEEWGKKDESDWDFDYEDCDTTDEKGTRITISNLNPGMDTAFGDPVFRNELLKLIARDYAFFIDKGFSITVCGHAAPSYKYQMKSSGQIAPAFDAYLDDGVSVRIVAGLVDDLPDDVPDELTPDMVDRFGWYVVCNDRVVLPADKSDKTIWGDDGYKVWHGQYNGFAGFVFFDCKDQSKLPWTTTKREVDGASPLYRRALAKMKIVTSDFSSYTNRRKGDLEAAKEAEKGMTQVDVYRVEKAQPLKLPTLSTSSDKTQYANIMYKRPLAEVSEIRDHLGMRTMSYRDVGIHTFEYFRKMELGK